jgi:aerobic-type carbon monoxide dehydrogenase small subunit (CoxS/CutS family)
VTDEQHEGNGAPGGPSRWDPLPQGEYDDGATAFVELPEGGIDALLAAPGHGFVPPRITAVPHAADTADPAAPTPPAAWHQAAPAPQSQELPAQWSDAAGYPDPGHQWGQTEKPYDTGAWNTAHATGVWESDHAQAWIPPQHVEHPEHTEHTEPPEHAEQTTPAEHAEPAEHPEHAEFAEDTAERLPEAEHTDSGDAGATGALPPEVRRDAPGERAGTQNAEAAAAAHDAAGSAPAAGAAGVADAAEAAEDLSSGASAQGADADGELTAHAPLRDDHPLASYVLHVNGVDRPVTDAWLGESLLYVLRERLGLAGAKDGCSQGECGACNVQVDGRLVASCLVPAVTTAGSEVRTVEGLPDETGRPSDVQRALARCGAVQCGFCIPGMAMTVHDLLERNPAPTRLDARTALSGNLCRCSGYGAVLDAVEEVVAERGARRAAEAEAGEEAFHRHDAATAAGFEDAEDGGHA